MINTIILVLNLIEPIQFKNSGSVPVPLIFLASIIILCHAYIYGLYALIGLFFIINYQYYYNLLDLIAL